MDWFLQLFRKTSTRPDEQIINAAMKLALEWGANFNQPIQERLMKMYPTITRANADEMESLCKEIKRFSFDLYFAVPQGKMTDTGVQAKIQERYPFLSREIIQQISTQGMYYAHK